MDKCAPGKNFKDGSCFNKNDLHVITKAVNSKSKPENHIDINQSKKELVEDLSIKFSSPNTNHESSDNCGVEILGAEENNFWKDNKGAKIITRADPFARKSNFKFFFVNNSNDCIIFLLLQFFQTLHLMMLF